MRCDCTAEPPGELMASATAAPFMAKARSRERATVEMVRPGLSGVEKPITPERRTTGTTARCARKRGGSSGPSTWMAFCRMAAMGKHIGRNRAGLKAPGYRRTALANPDELVTLC